MMTTKDAFIANVFEVFFDIQFLFEVPAGAQCFVMRLNQSTKVLANTLLEKDELENRLYTKVNAARYWAYLEI